MPSLARVAEEAWKEVLMIRRNVENVIGRHTIDEERRPRLQKAALHPLEEDPAGKAGRAS